MAKTPACQPERLSRADITWRLSGCAHPLIVGVGGKFVDIL